LAALFGLGIGGATLAHTPKSIGPAEQAVIVHFDNYGSTDLTRLFALDDSLRSAIAKAHVGDYDGHEIRVDGSDGFLYMYGPNADELFDVVRPILERCPFTRGATVKIRYGPPAEGVPERKVAIAS
jgi:hypothetical protein